MALEGDEAEANLSSLKHKRLGIVHMRGGDLAILFFRLKETLIVLFEMDREMSHCNEKMLLME